MTDFQRSYMQAEERCNLECLKDCIGQRFETKLDLAQTDPAYVCQDKAIQGKRQVIKTILITKFLEKNMPIIGSKTPSTCFTGNT